MGVMPANLQFEGDLVILKYQQNTLIKFLRFLRIFVESRSHCTVNIINFFQYISLCRFTERK